MTGKSLRLRDTELERNGNRRVVFLTAMLPHYRVAFHEGVRSRLASSGIQYEVIFGQPNQDGAFKADAVSLAWGHEIVNRYFDLGGFSVVWQPALGKVWASDLVVIGQENRLLVNYVVQSLRSWCRPKVAFWGHGRNFQADPRATVTARWKRFWATKVDWWFTYTNGTGKIIESYGFPPQRITVFHNTIDTSEIRRLASEIDQVRLDEVRQTLGVNSKHVGIYVGGIYDHKRIDFLLKAAEQVRRNVPDFVLIVVGSGAERDRIETAASQYSWIKYVGPLFGRSKVEMLRLAKVFMMPGLVGLAILDCAAIGLPIVTTAFPYHSPEIEYLQSGRNGLVVKDWLDEKAYAEAVISVLNDDAMHSKLAHGSREIGTAYTMGRMVQSFSDGVIAALSAPKY